MIATASHDLTGRLVRVSLDSDTGGPTSSTLASLHLHTSPLSAIAYSRSGEHLLTASWDTLIGLWESRIPEEDEVDVVELQTDRRKRRKVGGRDSEPRPKRKAPSSVLKSHTARVSKAAFSSTGEAAFSCGFDSTVRSWDVENGVCTNTIVGLMLSSAPSTLHPSHQKNLIIPFFPLVCLDRIRKTNGRYGSSSGRQFCCVVLSRPQRLSLRLSGCSNHPFFGYTLVYALVPPLVSNTLPNIGFSDHHGFVRWSSKALGSQEYQERRRKLQSVGRGKEDPICRCYIRLRVRYRRCWWRRRTGALEGG